MYPIVPVGDTPPEAYGSDTAAISGSFPSAETKSLTDCRIAGSVSVVPAGDSKTMRALAPSVDDCGNLSARRSCAACDSVPGIDNVLTVGPDSVAAPTPPATSRTTQKPTIAQRRRNASRESLYRNIDMRVTVPIHDPVAHRAQVGSSTYCARSRAVVPSARRAGPTPLTTADPPRDVTR